MKKLFLFSLLLLFQFSFSQVSMSKGKLNKEGQTYKLSEYEQVFQNPDAIAYFKKYRTNNTVSLIFGGAGGACIGFGLARALSGGDKTVYDTYGVAHELETKGWELVGIGAGLVAIGIPFALSAKKNQNKAIDAENGKNTAFQPYFKMETLGTGLALSYIF